MTLTLALTHHFPGFTLNAEFQAPPGVTALFGRSGSGKTTIVNAVAGLLTPTTGRITLNDTTLLNTQTNQNLPPHRRRIGYVFQDARLFPHLTVRQNLLYGRWFAPRTQGPTLSHITDLLGITHLLNRRPGALSGGERQRVALGRAILSNPQLLLMDEPLAALDDARKAEILPYLERLRDDLNLPILYVSHSMAEVARLATTIVLLDAGRVTAAGPAADILSDPQTAQSFGLRETGAILQATVAAQDSDDLTRLITPAGPLWLPQINAPTGSTMRLRILAQDIMLSLQRPEGISALNVLPTTISEIQIEGPGALIQLRAGDATLLARITRRSATTLALQPGQKIYAVLKAVSVAQENVGTSA